MEITKKTFCTNIRNISDGLRTSYICEKTGRVCPKLDYSSGKPLPSKLFMKNGCPLMKEERRRCLPAYRFLQSLVHSSLHFL